MNVHSFEFEDIGKVVNKNIVVFDDKSLIYIWHLLPSKFRCYIYIYSYYMNSSEIEAIVVIARYYNK